MSAIGDDWLQPEHFDWADDVEEDLLKKSQASSPSSDPIADSIEEDDHEYGDDFDPFYKEDEFEMLTPATSQHLLCPMEVGPEAFENIHLAYGEMEAEFLWRNYDTYMNPGIHHYNFLGQSVYEASATPPSQSLAVIMSGPKVPEAQEDLGVQSIIRRANMFVDPVILNLDGIDESILHQRGFELQRAVTGRVSTFYTPHGTWMGDNSEQTAFNVCDTGDVHTYVSNDVAVGNGFIGRGCIASRDDWIRMRDERMSPLGSGRLPRKMTWSPKPSPLRQSKIPVGATRSDTAFEKTQPHTDHQQSVERPRDHTNLVTSEPVLGGLQSHTNHHPDIGHSDTNFCSPTFRSGNRATTDLHAPKQTQRGRSKLKKRHRRRPDSIIPQENPEASRDPDVYFSFPEPGFTIGKRRRVSRFLGRVWDLFTESFTGPSKVLDDGNKVFCL